MSLVNDHYNTSASVNITEKGLVMNTNAAEIESILKTSFSSITELIYGSMLRHTSKN